MYWRETGYLAWKHSIDGDAKTISVHRLVAVAEYGFDATIGMDVHHINGVKWDNRPENLDLVDRGEHRSAHKRKTTWLDTLAMAEMYRENPSTYALAPHFGVCSDTVARHIRGFDEELMNEERRLGAQA